MVEFPQARILLFAKEPVYGQVKTRLNGAIGAEDAFRLHCAMLRYQVEKLQAAGLAPWELWVSGNPANVELTAMKLTVPVHRQEGSDLGERMESAAESALQESQAVILVGTDCPSVSVDYLRDALARLQQGNEVVIGPAEDGGYVLLGLRQHKLPIFSDMPWGTNRVFQATRRRLESAGLEYTVLPELWDVDRTEDLPRLSTLRPPLDFQLDEGS